MERTRTSPSTSTNHRPAVQSMTLDKLKQQVGDASTDEEVNQAVKDFVALHLRGKAPVKELLECAKPATYTRLCVGIAEKLSNIDPDTDGVESIGVEPWLDLLDCSHHVSFETTKAEGLRSTCFARLAQSIRTDEDCASVARAYATNVGNAGVPGISDVIGHVPQHALPSFCEHLVTQLRKADVRDEHVWSDFLRSARQALTPDYQLRLVPIVCQAVQALGIGSYALGGQLIDLVPDNAVVEEGLDALVWIARAIDDAFRNNRELVRKAVTIVGVHEPSSYATVARKLMQADVIRVEDLGHALVSAIDFNFLDENARVEAIKSVLKAIPCFDQCSIGEQLKLLARIKEAGADAWLEVLNRAKDAPYKVRRDAIYRGWKHLGEVGLAREPLWSDLLSATLSEAEHRSEKSSRVLTALFMACLGCGNYAGWAKAFALALPLHDLDISFGLHALIGRDGAKLPQLIDLLVTHLDANPHDKQAALADLFRHLAALVSLSPTFDFAHIAKAFALSGLPENNASWKLVVHRYAKGTVL